MGSEWTIRSIGRLTLDCKNGIGEIEISEIGKFMDGGIMSEIVCRALHLDAGYMSRCAGSLGEAKRAVEEWLGVNRAPDSARGGEHHAMD